MGFLSDFQRRSANNPMSFSRLSEFIDSLDGGAKTSAGVSINEATALNLSAVWAAVRVRSRTLASMPIHVYQRKDRGRTPRPDHPIHKLLHDRPNRYMTPYQFKDTLDAHVSTWGNAYAEKERNGRGDVVALWPITPNRVTPRWAGPPTAVEKVFDIEVEGVKKTLGADRIMHIPGPGFDGLMGYSRITLARESLGLAKASEEFGGKLFGQGLRSSGILSHPKALSEKARENLKRSINEQNAGLSNAHRMMLVEEGMTYTPNNIPPEDAQFLETRQFQVVEIARWFEVPPHKIADLSRATFSNIEHQSIEFATDTARPSVINWEGVLNWDLFSESQRGEFYAEFNMDALLRGDSTARGAYYSARFNIGSISQNEIREMENENPIEGGDRYYIQGALVPTDRIDDVIDSKKAAPPAPPPDPAAPEPDPMGRFRPVLLDAAKRVLGSELPHVRAAIKKGGDVAVWADGFYLGDHVSVVAQKLLPSCLVIDPVGGARMAGKLAAEWAHTSHQAVKQAARGGDVEAIVKEWESGRAEAWVESIIERKEAA